MVEIQKGLFGIWDRKKAKIESKAAQQAEAVIKDLPGFEYSEDAYRALDAIQNFQLQEAYVLKSEMLQLAVDEVAFMRECFRELCDTLKTTPYEIKDSGVKEKPGGKKTSYLLECGAASSACYDFLNQYGFIKVEDMEALYKKICGNFNILARQEAILNKGEDGEKYIEQQLSMFRNKYYIRQNILLPSVSDTAQTSETDVYIITAKGILVCEVKNWGGRGQTICISRDGRWAKRAGGQMETMKSPVLQNSRHCMDTEDYLLNNGIRDIKLLPVVIIANEDVEIENMSSNVIVRVSELYNYIENLEGAEVYSEKEQRKIADLLDECGVSERRFKILQMPDKDGLLYNIQQIGFLYNEGMAYKENVNKKLYPICYKEYRAEKKLEKKKQRLINLLLVIGCLIGAWIVWKVMLFGMALILYLVDIFII